MVLVFWFNIVLKNRSGNLEIIIYRDITLEFLNQNSYDYKCKFKIYMH
jgi:hypothetical protein